MKNTQIKTEKEKSNNPNDKNQKGKKVHKKVEVKEEHTKKG